MTPISLLPHLPGLASATDPRVALPAAILARHGAGAEGDTVVSVKVSDAALLLRSVLEKLTLTGRAAAQAAGAPLIDSHQIDLALLAQRLREAVVHSGVFYEAHQARWLAGELDTQTLRREPQGRIAESAAQIASDPAQEVVEAQRSTNASTTVNMPAALLPQVERQLHFLTHGELCWHQQAWPGQPLQWRIAHQDERAAGDSAQERVWHTTLRLQLPQLGELEIALRLSGEAVALRLKGEAHALAALSAGLPQLAEGMRETGITLQSSAVQAHD